MPVQTGGGGGHPVCVPVACCVSDEFVLHVWVNVSPSQTVEGSGFQVPAQVVAHTPVVDVPVAGRVFVASVLQVCVKLAPRHSVDGSGPQVPKHTGGGVFLHPDEVSVPVAGRVLLSQALVCVNETPSQIVETSGPQCAERFEKHVGCPHDSPAVASPAAIGGHMSSPHSHASASQGQPPGGVSSIHQSPSALRCSPVGDPAMYLSRWVASDS